MATKTPAYKEKKKQVTDFRDQKLLIPEFPLVYETKRTYWLLQALSSAIEKDPTSVNPKQYLEVVSHFAKLAEQCRKEGVQNAEGRKKKRMEREGLEEVGHEVNEAVLGKTKSDGLGVGVRTSNPFA